MHYSYLCEGDSTTITSELHQLINTECVFIEELQVNVLSFFLAEKIKPIKSILVYIPLLHYLPEEHGKPDLSHFPSVMTAHLSS